MSNPSLVRKLSQWLSGTTYNVGDVVWTSANGIQYPITCLVTHIAGTFATDVVSNYWQLAAPTRNYIINGNFDFWQRGTSVSVNGYLADRFAFSNVTSAGTFTRTRSTDVPTFAQSGFQSTYSDLITIGTADASLAGDERAFYYQVIEGSNFQKIFGKKVTLSFWVKCSKTGTQSVAFNNSSGAGGAGNVSYVATYTINSPNTWEKKIITVDMETSGTWGLGSGYGLSIAWSLCTSATNQFATSTVNQWITAPSPSAKYHNIGNLNLFDTSGATWRIAQIQLEEGPVPATFKLAGDNIASELQLCQRYFEKSFDIDVAPVNGGATLTGNGYFTVAAFNNAESAFVPFKAVKRVAPTIVKYGNSSGFWAAYSGAYTYAVGNGVGNSWINGFSVTQQVVAAIAPSVGHYTADAEL
jgi:hypothetical protein